MTTTNLKTRELMFEMRKDSMKEHLDMLIRKSERQAEELRLMKKRMDKEESSLVGILEIATEYVENTNWHLTRGISLVNDFLIARMLLEEETNEEP